MRVSVLAFQFSAVIEGDLGSASQVFTIFIDLSVSGICDSTSSSFVIQFVKIKPHLPRPQTFSPTLNHSPDQSGHSRGSPENSISFRFCMPLDLQLDTGWLMTLGVVWFTVPLFQLSADLFLVSCAVTGLFF